MLSLNELKAAKKDCERDILQRLQSFDQLIWPAQVKRVEVFIHSTRDSDDPDYTVEKVNVDIDI